MCASRPSRFPDASLVGLTTTTITACRAYEIGDRYRERGSQVVIGGRHCRRMALAVPENSTSTWVS